jgi:hypothetical protein
MKTTVLLRLLLSTVLLSYSTVLAYLVSVQVYQPQDFQLVYFLLGSMMISLVLAVMVIRPVFFIRSFS